MTKTYIINGKEYVVSVNSLIGNRAEVKVNGTFYQVEISDNKTPAESTAPVNTLSQDNIDGRKNITAPLPGVITDLKVKAGDMIKTGQTIAVLEAMKMENEIQSEYSGTVLSVDVNIGDSVLEGVSIVTLG